MLPMYCGETCFAPAKTAISLRLLATSHRRPSFACSAHKPMMSTASLHNSIPPASLDAGVLRGSLERHRASLVGRLAAGVDGMALGRANARFLDGCFKLLFEGIA